MARKKLTVSKTRSALYKTARILGDIQAASSGSGRKVARRIGRRTAGKATGRLLGRIFK